ncbi:GGDEF domain-containing protein [Spartinivicinus poritis]|uniref:diguanylate cyclase n=1 Tax=Spartinivicinus poritis TaxID=2994640 RepID=A0ABT5UB97_9GAMM|nr:GGDEF domain-containing protein [Spartinivicinus sp. A2-2]MDE1463592.1 diguanylate cyclase [Spartinivicinus sp. A2-2]
MTGLNATSEDSQHWRNKYADKLAELDKLEQTAIEKIDQLRKALLVVNLACHGLHPALDVELTRFNKALRGENLSLDISRPLETLQEAAEPVIEGNYRQQTISALETALDAFNNIELGKQTSKEIKQYRKQIKQQSLSYSELPQLIEQFAELVAETLPTVQQGSTDLEADTKEPGKGLWQRLFGAESEEAGSTEHKADSSEDEQAVSDELKNKKLDSANETTVVQPDQQVAPTVAAEVSEQRFAQMHESEQVTALEQKFTTIIEHVGECLAVLLNQLAVPESVVDDSQYLKKKTEQGLTWFELVPALETVNVIILATIGELKAEFEHYLKTLNERLHTFQSTAVEAQADYQQALESADRYNQLIQQDLGELQNSVEQATDLEDLKQVVSNQLDKVLESLESQHTQLDNPPSLTDQLTQLVQRVSQMETQTKELENTLYKERAKALEDTLTGIANRQAYEERARYEFARWKRYQQPLVFAVADVDFFKKINDNYGHLAGDNLLKIIAKQLNKRLREVDFIARYGGEEFVIIMPNTNIVDAKSVMDSVRQGIADAPFHYQGNKLQITASFGLAACREGDESPKVVFDRADKALYEAKQTGRNRCCVA